MKRQLEDEVSAHYHKAGLLDAIVNGLTASGADPDAPTLEELAPVDEFHTAGRAATLMALDMAPEITGIHVLDAGCGIGGTARYLAKEKGCQVTGIDLTASFIEIATALSERTGLAEACDFHTGSVLDMPFENNSFAGAVSFHVAMNIADRSRFYSELARVLKPRAHLCVFDVMKGPEEGLEYPVPWAETEVSSFLKTPRETSGLLELAGFEVVRLESLRDFAIEFFQKAFAKAAQQDGPAPLGLHLLTGANTAAKFQNYAAGLDNGQIDPTVLVATRN